MPTVSPNSASYRQMSNATFRQGLESILNGTARPIIKECKYFHYLPVLNKIFFAIYRCLGVGDEHAERVVNSQKGEILKCMLKAFQSHEVQTIQINYPNSNDPTQFGFCQDSEGRLVLLHRSIDNHDQIIEQDLLDIDVEKTKSECLHAYIQSERDVGRVVDLSDIDLSRFNLDNIAFTGMKIRAEDLSALANLGRPVNLVNVQVEGTVPAEMRYLDVRIDKAQTLHLIQAGVDKRMMIAQYLRTEHESSHTNIDLRGFDLRGLNLEDFDFRGVDFSQTIIGKAADGLTPQARQESVIVDHNIVLSQLDFSQRELFKVYFGEKILLDDLPDCLEGPMKFQEPTMQQYLSFVKKIDAIHSRNVYLRALKPENLRFYNGKIFFLNKNTCCTKSGVLTATPIDPHSILPADLMVILAPELADFLKSRQGSEREAEVWKKLDQYATFVIATRILRDPPEYGGDTPERIKEFWDERLPDGFLKPELLRFLEHPFSNDLLDPMHTYFETLGISEMVRSELPAVRAASVEDGWRGIRLMPSWPLSNSPLLAEYWNFHAEQVAPPFIQNKVDSVQKNEPAQPAQPVAVASIPDQAAAAPSVPSIPSPKFFEGIPTVSREQRDNEPTVGVRSSKPDLPELSLKELTDESSPLVREQARFQIEKAGLFGHEKLVPVQRRFVIL